MKCCSRSTLGVIVGILNILICIIASIVLITAIQQVKVDSFDTTAEEREQIAEFGTLLLSSLLATCLVMIVISGVLIMGIVKRRDALMLPWLFLSGVGFICECGRVVISLIVGIAQGHPITKILIMFIFGSLGICIQAAIIWAIYTLWRDIRRENNQRLGQAFNSEVCMPDAPPKYDDYNSLPQKS